jgi:hypothetical protein
MAGRTMDRKKQRLFVIFSCTPQNKRVGTHYIKEGTGRKTTTIRAKAAKFSTFEEIQQFATRNHIALDAHTYIGPEDFTAHDLKQMIPRPTRIGLSSSIS